jgi:hypothetical protein
MDPLGLFGVLGQERDRIFPKFPSLWVETAYFKSAGIFGELIETDAVNERVTLRAGQRFEREAGVAVGAVLDDGMGDGRHLCSVSMIAVMGSTRCRVQ